MAITGVNSIVNTFVPTFQLTNLVDGQGLIFDATKRAFVNSSLIGSQSSTVRLGELLDVSPNVDNQLSLQDGQLLTYDATLQLWVNKTHSQSFISLSDVTTPSLPNGYVKWNSAGNTLVYSTSIPVGSITGLAPVALSGDYNDLTNKPSIGTVTSVSVTSNNGIGSIVLTPTTTPAITLTLGAITPTSVHASGTVLGSNLSGTNTGDQTITLIGDVGGSGVGTFTVSLQSVNSTPGVFGNQDSIPVITTNGKGLITNATTVSVNPKFEKVVLRFGTGSAGVLDQVDAIFSHTAGVTATVIDATNCVVRYSFTGYTHSPTSIITYAQNTSTNEFLIKDAAQYATPTLNDAGTVSNPDIINSTFSVNDTISLTTTQTNAGIIPNSGIRAFLVILFKF